MATPDLSLRLVEVFDSLGAAINRLKARYCSGRCRAFSISRNTLDLWLKRREATGSVAPIRHYHRGPNPKINDLDAFRAFAQTHGHLTQQQMADRWPLRKTLGTFDTLWDAVDDAFR
jgi:transposase